MSVENQDRAALMKEVYGVAANEAEAPVVESTPEPIRAEEPAKAEAPKVEEAKAETAESAKIKSFNDVIKEKYGDKYKSEQEFFEDFEKKPNEVEKIVEKPIDYANERLKKLDEYVRGGGKEEDFYKTQFTNWNEKSSEEVVKAKLREQYPKVDEKGINILFKKEYDLKANIPADELTEDQIDEIELAKIKMQADSDKYRDEFIQKQVKLAEPPSTQQKIEQERLAAEAAQTEAEKLEADRKDWQLKIQAALNKTKDISFTIPVSDDSKETVEVKYAITEEDVQSAKNILENPNELWNDYTAKDGTVDIEKFAKDMILLKTMQKAFPAMANSFHADRMADYERRIKQPNYSRGGGDNKSDAKDQEQVRLEKHVAARQAAQR